MKSNLRKALALLLTLIMVMTSLPTSALAEMFAEASQSIQPFAGAKLRSVIKPDDEDVYVTFTFKNEGTVVDTQIINRANGETLKEPATPSVPEGKRFDGWYVDNNTKLDFDKFDPSAYTGEVTVDAKFTNVYYVYFLDKEEKYVYYTAEVTGDTVTVGDMAAANQYEFKDSKLQGWVIRDTSTPFTEATPVTGDTYVTPVTIPAYWITFNTDGGMGVPSQYVAQGKSIDLSTVDEPTKLGYAFAGWKNEAGEDVTNTTITPEKSMTLKAQWTASQVKYTVVYWGENADDTNYSVLATDANKTALTGTKHTLTASTGALPTGVENRQHFTFEKSDTVTIAADGSSVLNVYYKRNTYTLTFREGGGWSGYNTVATITAKYNAKISGEFSKAPFNTTYNGRAWKCTDSDKYSYALQTLDRMPGFDATFNLYQQSSYTLKTIYYYVQKVGTTVSSSSWPTSTANFDLLKQVDTYFNYATYDEEYHEIQGFTRYAARTAGFRNNRKDFSGNALSLYYLRDKYNLILNNYGVEDTHTVEYEAPLAQYNKTPARPEGFSENAEFKGWYTVDPSQVTEGIEPFDFENQTMPVGGMVLYALWKEPQIKVTIEISVTVGAGFNESNKLAAGSTIADSAVYAKAVAYIATHNLVLLKWVDAEGNLVDINQPLYADKTIHPVFSGTTYELKYDLGTGATGAAPVDGKEYGPDSLARVMGTDATLNGQPFAYWTNAADAAGTRYYPGAYIKMTANTTLTAHYAPLQEKVSVTYHANYPGSNPKSVEQHQNTLNNGTIEVLRYETTGLKVYVGYTFQGWATTANGSVVFAAGASARVNNQETNDLYAVWAPSTNTKYTVQYYWQNVNDNNFTLHEEDELSGTTGATATADEKTYTGLTLNKEVDGTLLSGTIAADGSLVLKLYYIRNTYTVTFNRGANGHLAGEDANGNVTTANLRYGADTPTAPAVTPDAGYTFSDVWNPAIAPTVTGDATYTAQYAEDGNVTIFYTVDPTNGGTVSPTEESLAPATGRANGSTATANPGWKFTGWTLNQNADYSSNSAQLTPAKGDDNNSAIWTERTYVAHFERTTAELTVEKQWLDDEGYTDNRVPVTLTIGRRAGNVEDADFTETVSLTTTVLSKTLQVETHHENGTPYTYYIREENATNAADQTKLNTYYSSDLLDTANLTTADKTLTAKNTLATKELTIFKAINPELPDTYKSERFAFAVAKDGDSTPVLLMKKNDDNSVERIDKIELVNGESITLILPIGTYTVSEVLTDVQKEVWQAQPSQTVTLPDQQRVVFTNTVKTGKITVNKVWVDEKSAHSDVTVSVTGANGFYDMQTFASSKTFEVPLRNVDGTEATYAVLETDYGREGSTGEVDVSGFYQTFYKVDGGSMSAKAPAAVPANKDVTVYNVEMANVQIQKRWDNYSAEDIAKLYDVEGQLTYTVLGIDETVGFSIPADGSWKTVKRVPLYTLVNDKAEKIAFAVVETGVYLKTEDGGRGDNIIDSFTRSYDQARLTITNTYTGEGANRTITVNKTWQRPAYMTTDGGVVAEFTLYRYIGTGDAQKELNIDSKWVKVGDSKQLPEPTDGWTTTHGTSTATERVSFAPVPKYDANGNEIIYAVKEAGELGYYAPAQAAAKVDNTTNSVSFTNTMAESATLTITKTAFDVDGETAVNEGTFKFEIRRGNAVAQIVTIDLAKGGSESVSLVPGTYTVTEIRADAWDTTYTVTADGKTTNSVTGKEVENVATGSTVSFVNKRIKGSITVNKQWVDGNSQINVRPEPKDYEEWLKLYQQQSNGSWQEYRGTKSLNVATTEDSNLYTITYSGMPEKATDGTNFIYAVKETIPADKNYYTLTVDDVYKVTGTDDAVLVTDGGTMTNTLSLGSLTIEKVIEDASDENYSVGFDFTVKLNGVDDQSVQQTITVDSAKEGKKDSVTIDNLPLGEYTVTETTKIGWTAKNGKTTDSATVTAGGNGTVSFTNTRVLYDNKEEPGTINVTKIWKLLDEKQTTYPDVTFTLMQKLGDAEETDYQKLTLAGTLSGKFTNVPKYAPDGTKYVYTVRETNIPIGYVQDPDVQPTVVTDENGTTWTFTNKQLGADAIAITKKWEDDGDKFVLRPDEKTFKEYVKLARSTDNKNWELFDWDKTVSEKSDNEYTVVFSGMPKTDAAGEVYLYRVVEYMTMDKASNKSYYTASSDNGYMTIGTDKMAMYAWAANGETITNTLKTETLTIKKVVEGYVGDATGDDLTFSFTISPSDNKVKMDKMETPTITVKPTERSAETYVTLPAGEYTVTENHNDAWTVSVRHNDPQVEPTVVPTDGTQTSNSSATLHTGNTVIFTNTRNMFNGNGKYTVVKKWQRYDENEAFPNVTIELSDGARTRSVELKSEAVEVDGQNANLGSISHIFENLPAYDLKGEKLTYTATESYIPGYTAGEPVPSDVSTTFTNTADAFALTVYKKWVDGDGNAYTGELPASVTVKLWRRIAGGEETLYKTATLDGQNVDESGRWYDAASFGGPTHDAEGRPYEYFVTEDTVEGFTPEKSRLTMADFAKETDASNLYSAELVNRKVEDGEKQPEKTVAADFKTVQITDETTGKMVEDGDELTYTIGYYNHLSVPATVVVTDALNENLAFDPADNPGAEYHADTHTVTWTIEGVNPCSRGSVELKVKVMLTDDALASEDPTISNTAGVQIGNRPVQTAASEDVTVYNPRLKVDKITANVPAKGYYALGETAVFEITASNTGNVLLKNIVITEQLEGAEFVQSGDYTVEDGKAIIAALNPGQSVVVRAQYTVKLDDLYAEDDQQQAPMKNIVTATAQSGDDPVDGGDESEFKPDQLTHLTVEKHWVDDLAVQRGDVRVQLTADGESYTADSRYNHEVIISSEDNLSPADENVWVMEFDNLPKHNADGSEIRYSAVETHVDGHGDVTDGRCDGYDVTVADDPAAHTTVITNTAQRKKFTVHKVWKDGEGDLAESLIPDTELTVALFVDGFDMDDDAFRTTLTRANGWKGKIDRMFAYNQAGVAYEYTPMEMDANGNAIADGGSIVIDGVTYDVSITTQTEPDANRAEAHRDVTVIVTNTRRSDDPEENKPTKEANLAPGKTTVSVGDSLTYTISYHNSRNVKADVTITDVLEDSLNFGSASHGGTYDPDTRTVTWVLRDVAAFASDAVTLTVTVNEKAKQADDAATVKNTATVVIPGNEPDIRTNTVEIPVEPEEGVKPTKKAVGIDPAKDTVEIGQKVEYRIGYRNHKNTAVSVRIVDKLDDGVKFISASDGGVYDAAKHTVIWNIAKLAPFADGEVTLTVEVTEAARKLADDETMATVKNTATVKFDNDPETETNVVDIPVKPNDPKKPEKKAEGLNATDTKKVGDEIVYTITYVNNLNKKAKVVVTDALDEGVDFVEADNGGVYDKASHTVTWTFDSVDPFEGDAVKLTVKVNEKARQIKEGETTATVDNTAAVTVDNKTTTISDPVEIPVTPDKPTDPTKKADDKALNSFGKIAVGDQLPFTVSYVNNLNTVATVTVRDTLEEGLTFVSADNGGTYDEATRTVTWVLKDVEPFTSGSVTVITEVNENAVDAADPTVANSAVVKIGDQPEQTTEPAEVTVYNPAFSVEKKLTNLPAKGYFTAGETAAFDITVKNAGNVPLENVAVEELLDGVTFVQGEGYTIDGRIATIAALPIGEQIVLKAEYTVIEADLGNTDLANRITVRGEVPENPDDPDQPHNPEDKGDEEPIPVDECVEITGTKTWNDADNAYGARPDVILVMLLANGEEKIGTSASAETEWKYTFIQQPKHDADGNEVVYSIREEEVPGYDTTYSAEGYDITNTLRRHTLTIRYWIDEVGGEQAFKTFTRDYYYGERYNVVSPAMDGYRADHEVVSGRIEGDLEVDVVYTAILWRLNIRYRRVGDGKTLAPMYTNGNVIIGDAYEVESPVIPGYTADRLVVKGEMHGRNMSFTVWYTPEQTEVVIVDEKTPFGLGNVVMNAGDCFE